MFRKIMVLAGVAGLMGLTPAWASIIYVSGDVSGTWSADTVIVSTDVRVPPGQTLTILPGVEVLFQGYYKFIVDNSATLAAAGTMTDSIRFDALTPNTQWHGIRFLSASNSSRLEYCHLSHGSATGGVEDAKGGAIYCTNSNPAISHSTLQSNSAASYGGGIYCLNASPAISDNTITGNSALFGGGIFCFTSNPTISGNIISYNSNGGGGCGGGIYCTGSNPVINSNVIRHNSSGTGGGLYFVVNPPAAFQFNEISENSASGFGGGLYLDRFGFTINKNTITGNTAFEGGGIFCNSSNPTVINSILWNNTPQQIYPTGGSNPVVNFSDIQGSWTGTGNINADPLFVNAPQSNYHLQTGSPCIDNGNPMPVYNDPDGSRADMGCYYFDQGAPSMSLILNPTGSTVIPASGGLLPYNVFLTNNESTSISFQFWCTYSQGATVVAAFGPISRISPSGPGFVIIRAFTQTVPGSLPAGAWNYNGYIGSYPGSIWANDSFPFTKTTLDGGGAYYAEGTCTGWEDEEVLAAGTTPINFELIGNYPNPFNPSTAISYQLSANSFVSLRVYDPAGRLVATLVDGWRAAGSHNAAFDGSGLAAGVYVAKLQAGNFTASQKIALLK